MTTSTNDADALTPDQAGGAFADGLTLIRILVTPVIMGLILWRWPETQVALLATVLLLVAALTDIFDDYFGGSARSAVRYYGYLDDAADTILMVGVLVVISIVLYRNGVMDWRYAVPASILIFRELIVAALKGGGLKRHGWPDNLASNLKNFFGVLGMATLVASPWLTAFLDRSRAASDNVAEVYMSASPLVWMVGLACLGLAAIASILSGLRILRHDFSAQG